MNNNMSRLYGNRALRLLIQFIVLVAILVGLPGCATPDAMRGAAQAAQAAVPVAKVPASIAIGEVMTISPGSTMYGITQALKGAPGTAIYAAPGDKFYIITWTIQGMGRAWASIANVPDGFNSWVRATGAKGSIVNEADWATMEGYLKTGGLTTISASAIAGHISTAAIAYFAQLALIGASTFPTILAVPVFSLDEMLKKINDTLFPQTGA
jgi:hypothetical protein